MVKKISYTQVVILLFSLVTLLGCGNDKALEENHLTAKRCDVFNEYAFVEAVDKYNRYSGGVIIDFPGITFRVKPINYAKDISAVDYVCYQRLSSQTDIGSLSVVVRDRDSQYTEKIGLIDTKSWSLLKEYLKKLELSYQENED